ncbi:MAG: lysoplasmalogenase family protein [Candidatus Thorarchaeota archaeon]|jgi:hypothetical protein
MSLAIFGFLFWVFAILFTAYRSKQETKNVLTTVIKMAPAFIAAVFILISGSSLFYILLAAALIFCGLGDVGMEVDILPGLGLFLISHFIFVGNFMLYGFVGATVLSFAGFAICFVILLVYLFFYFKYVKTAEEPMPAPFEKAAYFYAIMISLTTCSTLLLWLTTGALLGFLPFIGAILFVISDSMIVIKEFHHKFKFSEELTLLTYYAGIFLLSLAAIIFVL